MSGGKEEGCVILYLDKRCTACLIKIEGGIIMSLKKLSLFQYFDIDTWLAKKKLMSVGIQEWRDFETQRVLGTKIDVVIVSDETDYGNSDGNVVNNLYEKLSVKIPAKLNNVPMNTVIRLVNPEAVVYGEYRNALSITAENIEIVGK